jgi:Tol biopolymer transport system component
MSDHDFDQLLTSWFDADSRIPEPDVLLSGVLERTSRSRRIPTRLLLERWLPASAPVRGGRRLFAAPALLVVILLIVLAIAVALVGAPRRLPPPFGPAANGLIAFDSGGHIVVADPDGSHVRAVTSGPMRETSPVFSREGTRIAYVESAAPDADPSAATPACLVIANADGSSPVSIETNCDGISPPSWSPDDRFVVYSRGFAPNIEQVFVAAADGSSPPRRIGDPTQHSWGPGWSPDGHTISFVGRDPATGREQIYLSQVDGSGLRRLTTGSWSHVSGADQWSPDGRTLLFAAGDDPSGYEIWAVGPDGHAAQVAVPHGDSEYGMAWSPDGRRIAYLAAVPGQLEQVHVVTIGGSDDQALPGFWRQPPIGWSPDGTKVVVTETGSSPLRFRILDAAGVADGIEIVTSPPPSSETVLDAPSASWQRLAP